MNSRLGTHSWRACSQAASSLRSTSRAPQLTFDSVSRADRLGAFESPKSPLEGKLPTPLTTVVQPKNRLYWYIKK